ncbi:hypothetical protein [Paraburkholderia sp. MM5384-R2]|uniref:hypothetical protein n=1 Tax=Paraburkholderia sp. MM5384-R2 TaxID=2723097 RepID=UPI0016193E9D|nr:hypothetical protein [Paraburkholderia sp. MM5384-R2]MBB5501553.1 choline dehydrogenase-like flavoprotein [Paraburkholderia sp. MM5384-R2]
MSTEASAAPLEPRDDKELLALVDDAGDRFADMHGRLYELSSLFLMLAGGMPELSPERTVAQLGARIAEQAADEAHEHFERFTLEAERHGS